MVSGVGAVQLSTGNSIPADQVRTAALGLSLILPMYNERENVNRTLSAATEVLERTFSDYEIIVVDDGSTDGSTHLVEVWQRQAPRIRLIRHTRRQGYGAALSEGFAAASKPLVMYTDLDLPCDLAIIPETLGLLDRADVVIGYRRSYGGSSWRRLQSGVYNWLIRLLFGLRVRDIGFSCKLFRSEALRCYPVSSQTGLIAAEVLINAARGGYRIVEVPVQYQSRLFGVSKMGSLRVTWGILRELIVRYPIFQSRGTGRFHGAGRVSKALPDRA